MGGSARCRFIFIAASVAIVAPSGALTVAERGKTADSVVVLPADATEANRTAAREFVDGIKRLTGVALPVVSNACDSVAARRIVLCRDTSFPESSFRIEANGGELRITGADRGLCYGVFETLERFGDVEWFTEEVESFPRLDRFEVPDGFCETQRPAIRMRRTEQPECPMRRTGRPQCRLHLLSGSIFWRRSATGWSFCTVRTRRSSTAISRRPISW